VKGVGITAARKIRVTASVFELPQKLGIFHYIEYEPPSKERHNLFISGRGVAYGRG
jgi:hypothetical protein